MVRACHSSPLSCLFTKSVRVARTAGKTPSLGMSDYWANRMTVPVVRAKEFAELSACYQEALKDRGALDCTYKLWSEMTAAEKAKVAKRLPSTANNWYVN